MSNHNRSIAVAGVDMADDLRDGVLMASVGEILDVLKAADDLYYNDQESFLTDNNYDALRRAAERLEPHNVYFTGVGTDVRGGKIKLPFKMGSLDQVQVGEIADWVGTWGLQQEFLIATDKLDGTSALVIYDSEGNLQIAYSRGNGIEGADITRHIRHLVPKSIGRSAAIRGEVIIPKSEFDLARKVASSRSGKEYKNARNMVAGLMNAKKNPTDVYNHIHFVAYEVLQFDGVDKVGMLCDLEDWNFRTPNAYTFRGSELTDGVLSSFLEDRRKVVDYEIDGLVIDVNLTAVRTRMNPSRDTLNPAYSIKYKVADASNIAIADVVAVHWAASKHGYLKPRVEIDPVDLVGVTVTYATGFNAKFIKDNGIGPGAQVKITRSGDVIPFIQEVVFQASPQLPDEKFVWVDNDQDDPVDIQLIDYNTHRDVIINRIVDFFDSIDAPHLKKGNITKLFDDGFKTTEEIITCPVPEFVRVLGKNGRKIYDGLHDKALVNIPAWKLMGATNFFGRGIGGRKVKKLIQALGYNKLLVADVIDIAAVDGFDDKTAKRVFDGIEDYLVWLNPLTREGYITIDTKVASATGSLSGQNIVFTGFRNKDLQQKVEDAGANMQSAVSSKTTLVVAADPMSTSGKLKKARSLGITIISVENLEDML